MGHVLGSKPSLKTIQDYVSAHWGTIGTPIVQYFRSGWFSFRFSSEEEMSNVLRKGPWKVGSNSLILKHWSPSFSLEMERVARVPVWILFPGLDPYLWSEKVLSKMASKIGKPLFADPATTEKSKLSFAKIMVEVDVSKDLPTHVVLNVPNIGQITQKVVYEWLPYYCRECGKLVHTSYTCKKLQSRPKKPAVEVPVVELGGTSGSSGKQTSSVEEKVDSECVLLGQRSLPPASSISQDVPVMHSVSSSTAVPSEDLLTTNSFHVLSETVSVTDKEELQLFPSSTLEQGGTSGFSGQKTSSVVENVDSGCLKLGQRSLLHDSSSTHDVPVMHSECSPNLAALKDG
ncbi:uncharacterized protein LOC141590000 [Silene latifolia]|uniref:uncharacterized protein LOC141590000 n=1 Tax=Silene latifolia TaxID=37657 RepID=UPI003D77C09E